MLDRLRSARAKGTLNTYVSTVLGITIVTAVLFCSHSLRLHRRSKMAKYKKQFKHNKAKVRQQRLEEIMLDNFKFVSRFAQTSVSVLSLGFASITRTFYFILSTFTSVAMFTICKAIAVQRGLRSKLRRTSQSRCSDQRVQRIRGRW